MATCKYCAKSGWLVSVDGFGLCDGCHAVHTPEIIHNCRLYHSSVSTAVKSKNTSTTLNKLLVAGQCCKALEKYEAKGIETLGMPVQSAMALLENSFNAAVAEAVQLALATARHKAQTAASDTGRLGAYSSAADRLMKLANEFSTVSAFPAGMRTLQLEQDTLRVELLLKKSEVAEAKGQVKKALDHAIDAMMGLRHDATPDDLQVTLSERVTSRIQALGGTVPAAS